MRKLRGAIAGFGRMAAEAHLPAYQRAGGFEIAAIVDPAPESRARASELLPEAPAFPDLASMAAAVPKVDFVDVAAPPKFHAPLALEALERKLHVLSEKPLAITRGEMSELRRAVRRSPRALFTVHNWKHAPLVRRLKGLIAAGTVGDPTEIQWNVLRPNAPEGAVESAWRLDPSTAGGGVVMDHGWHAFYLMPYLTGREPRSLVARLERARGLDIEDNAEIEIDFGACVAKIVLSWTAAERVTRGAVRGPLGEIAIEDDALVVRVAGRAEDATRFSPALSAGSYHPEWFAPVLEEFRGEILHLDRRGRNLAEAALCSELMTAAYSSHGEPVSLLSPDV